MKAITLWQPWASLIIDGYKHIETRSNPWYYEGLVAIHAGLHVNPEACYQFGYNPLTIPTGAILGIVRKTGLFHFEKAAEEKLYHVDCFGDFTPGRYGYPMTLVEKFAKPIPAKGHQGFWDWEA
jgi:hypothetical protein